MTILPLDINCNGFCPGAKRAISSLAYALRENECVYLTGEILHNDIVNKRVNERRVILRNIPNKEDKKGVVVFPPHGCEKEKKESWINLGFSFIDTTCSFVKRNIEKIKNSSSNTLIIGKRNHQEVKTLLSYKKCEVVESIEELKMLNLKGEVNAVTQTTFNPFVLSEIKEGAKENGLQLNLLTNICPYMRERLKCIEKNLDRVDLFVIVGDETSSNAVCLLNKVIECKKRGILIQDENNVDSIKVNKKDNIMIVSATSTPIEVVKRVYNKFILL